MARPTTIRREQILDAARGLFLEQGLSVSTATIAKAAGVSEGTIFKRFSTKEELFYEAMCPTEVDLRLDAKVGVGDVRDTLFEAGLDLIAFFRDLIPRVMRLWAHSSPGLTPLEMMRKRGTPPPIRLAQSVARYVAAEMAGGRIAAGDPETVARTFIAAMHNSVFIELLSGEEVTEGAAERFARGVVDMLWRGIEPRPEGDE